ncbi:MAG: uroporphyrinogen-III synthase [bacterium]|nr:uroporphyrinogen-III synthase [bacterium]
MADNRTRRILVTRPQPAAGDFADRLRREGFGAVIAPMTEYVELDHHIGDIAKFNGFIFTSAQGVNIFARSFTERYVPIFAVGDATALTAEAAGFKRIYSAHGDAAALQELVATEKDDLHLKNMLHICGEDTAEDFGTALQDIGVYVERIPVYKAKFVDKMTAEATHALKNNEITTVTLLSARTAENFVKLVQADPALAGITTGIEVICLSDRVAEAAKPLPWRVMRIAASPQLDAVMDLIRDKDASNAPAMQADVVIDAFGGIRPLATKLDITPSTVQGWKERGTVPEARIDAVVKAAKENGIDPARLWAKEGTSDMSDSDKTQKPAQKPSEALQAQRERERRRGEDRRQRHTSPDNHGHIRNDSYAGPDRRASIDRRAFQERQEQRLRAEKWRFLNRSMVMGSLFTICALYGAGLLLAPELFMWKSKSSELTQMQARMDELNGRILQLQKERIAQQKLAAEEQRSLGQRLNDRIGQVESAVTAVGGAAEAVTSTASTAAKTVTAVAGNTEIGRNVAGFLNMLANLNKMNSTDEGRKQTGRAMDNLQSVLAGSPTDPNSLNAAIAQARKNDPTLNKLMGGVSAKDMGAAALLLGLNEFRNNINTNQSFEQDLLLMQKFAGDDPAMVDSLKRLSPYAKSGVLNRQQLQQEFKGLASDIVMAKLQGQDASVQQEAIKRMSKLVKVRRIDDVKGSSVDAVVARAQMKLNANDVRGAMQELQSLEGAPAATAAPFMEQAAGNVLADDASAQLLETILGRLQDPSNMSLEGLQGIASDVTGMIPGLQGLGDALGMGGMGGGGYGGTGAIPLGNQGFTPGVSGGDSGGGIFGGGE